VSWHFRGRDDDFNANATGVNLAGSRPPHAPEHTASVGGTKSLKVSAKTSIIASLGGRDVSDRFTNSANAITLPC
jgi:hypothetical protein